MAESPQTSDELSAELTRLRARVAELEAAQADCRQAELARDSELAALRHNEARWRHITDNMLDVVGLTDLSGVYQYVTPSIKAVAGYAPADLIGQTMFEHVHPDDLFRMMRVSLRTMRAGNIGRMELRYQHADGHYIVLDTVGTPARDETGRIIGAVMSARDITERKHAEEALRESELLYQSLVDVSPLSICRKDLAGRFTFANRRFLEFSHCSLADIIGRTDYDLHPPEMAEKYQRDDRTVTDTGQPKEFIEQRAVVGGETTIIHAYKTPVLDSAGNITGVQISFWDITARQRAEQAEREQRQLTDSLREVADLLNSTLDVATILDQMLTTIGRVVPHTSANVMLIDHTTGRARVARARGYGEQGRGRAEAVLDMSLPLTVSNIRTMIDTAQPVIINDVRTSPDWVLTPETAWTRSYLGAPIVLRDQTLGLFNLDSDQPHFFTAEHAQRLMAFAAQAATAIENARLFEAEHDARQLAEALRDTAAAVSGSLNLDDVLDQILEQLARIMPADGANILLVDGQQARIVRAYGRCRPQIGTSGRYDITHVGSLRTMRDTGEPLIVAHTHTDPRWQVEPGLEWIASYAGAPIYVHRELLGFLGLCSAQPDYFAARHTDRLRAFANHIALAVHNAQLHASIQRHAEELEARVRQRTRELSTANEQLAAANAQLTHLDQLKDQFILRISHELRTPLTNIKIYLELLEKGHPDKRPRYMTTLVAQSNRLQELIEDLLEVSQLDVAHLAFEPHPFNLNRVANDLVSEQQTRGKQRGLTLTADLQPDLPAALGDASLVFQAATRLMMNAVAYTPGGGGISVITRAQAQSDQRWITLTVQDTGPGISAKDLPHIFDRFYRGAAAGDYTVPGTGLGLAICQALIAKLDGRVTVESEPGQGAAFTIWLRAAQ